MGKKTIRAFTVLVMFLIVNSLIYYQLTEPKIANFSDISGVSQTSLRDESNPRDNDLSNQDETSTLIRKETIQGNYKNIGFFPYDIFTPALDSDGPTYELIEYDDFPGQNASATIEERYNWPVNWAPAADEYFLGTGMLVSSRKSVTFTPVFVDEHIIDGKAYFRILVHRDPLGNNDDSVEATLRLNLSLYNSTDQTSTPFASIEKILPSGNGSFYQDFKTYSYTFPSPVTVPAGFRIKTIYEVKFNASGGTGHIAFHVLRGTDFTWNINDPPYSSSYYLTGVHQTLGMQLYMKSTAFPDIDVYGVGNNTVYQSPQNLTIDVTDGSNSSFRWDGGSWISFENSTTIPLLSTHGWHDLEIKASDPIYNNTRTSYYKFGYDESINNIVLNGPPTNGSTINGGDLLNFTAYYVDTVTYEWDQNGTQFPLIDPYDIISPIFGDNHNLTIRTTDFYVNETLIYFFTFDSEPPNIFLDNVYNGSTYAPLKTIDVEIIDLTGVKNVKYHWDSDPNTTWNPEFGNIYRTNLPIADGNHYLYVYASDNFDHLNNKVFFFYADSNVFLVELQELTNNSYYLGGDTVKITIQKSNGTVRYAWDGNTTSDGSLVSSTLTLEGIEGIPDEPGFHELKIITFDTSNFQHTFYFIFIVDTQAPVIDSDISLLYNNSRFLDSQIFTFNITDNYVSGSNLTVLISIDGKASQLLTDPYQLFLNFFEDGQHYFYLYAIDKAGNLDMKYIIFVIDTTAPEIVVTIPDLVDFTTIDGNLYIPYNAEVIVNFIDDDPNVTTQYAWDNPPYITFTDSFTLAYSDNQAILRIKVFDSLDNAFIYPITLIIDGTNPTTSLLYYANETTKINYETLLSFETEDYSDDTINIVRYSWDRLPGFWFTSPNEDFDVQTLVIYNHNSIAKFFVYVEDIVGNNFIYTFTFLVDKEAPIADILIFDASEDKWVDASTIYYVQSEIPIKYND
jgi:hypothetical protein